MNIKKIERVLNKNIHISIKQVLSMGNESFDVVHLKIKFLYLNKLDDRILFVEKIRYSDRKMVPELKNDDLE